MSLSIWLSGARLGSMRDALSELSYTQSQVLVALTYKTIHITSLLQGDIKFLLASKYLKLVKEEGASAFI